MLKLLDPFQALFVATCSLVCIGLSGCQSAPDAVEVAPHQQPSSQESATKRLLEKGLSAEFDGSKGEALMYFEQAARLGSTYGALFASSLLRKSPQFHDHLARAYEYSVQAADDGDISSMYEVGRCLLDGTGTPQNSRKGIAMMERVAERDVSGKYRSDATWVALAEHELSVYFWNGKEIPEDKEKALMLCKSAALKGLASAQHSLGRIYENSTPSIPRASNDRLAYVWYSVAAASQYSSENWKADRDRVGAKLSVSLLQEAQSEASALFADIRRANK